MPDERGRVCQARSKRASIWRCVLATSASYRVPFIRSGGAAESVPRGGWYNTLSCPLLSNSGVGLTARRCSTHRRVVPLRDGIGSAPMSAETSIPAFDRMCQSFERTLGLLGQRSGHAWHAENREARGCYTLEVSWADGSWQSVFAVGN